MQPYLILYFIQVKGALWTFFTNSSSDFLMGSIFYKVKWKHVALNILNHFKPHGSYCKALFLVSRPVCYRPKKVKLIISRASLLPSVCFSHSLAYVSFSECPCLCLIFTKTRQLQRSRITLWKAARESWYSTYSKSIPSLCHFLSETHRQTTPPICFHWPVMTSCCDIRI